MSKLAFNYSGDPSSSPTDYLRFILGDTSPESPILQDAELEFIIAETATKTLTQRLALAFRAASNVLGSKLVKRSLGPQSEDATKRHEYYVSLANKYEALGAYAGTPPLPAYATDIVFEKNMMINEK